MSRMLFLPRGPMTIVFVAGAALGLYLLLMLVSFVDGSFAGSSIGRNISFAGTAVSGTPTDEVDTVVDALATEYASTPVAIDAGFGAATSEAATLGLSVDSDASADAVREANDPPLLTRPFAWLGSFVGTTDVAPRYVVDDAVMRSTLVDLEIPGVTEWRLPSIVSDATGVRLVPGATGSGIDADHFATELVAVAEAAMNPMVVVPQLVEIVPPVSDADAEAAALEAARATSTPLDVTVGEVTKSVPVSTLRSWLVLDIDESSVGWDIDHPLVAQDIAALFAEAQSTGSDVEFVVEGGQLAVVPGSNRLLCCEEGSSDLILTALRDRAGAVQLSLISEETTRGSEWAASLGIVEQVASFTTNHPCCQNRVVNIQLMADAIRGVIIEPGQTFSLNEHVGRRTAEKGYLPAGGITNGVMVDQLGGGVSQLTTTLFNAAFFAGLDFGEYQSHSIYFSRYPYGREATLSFPAPDLQIRNTSPYGVLIWPTYTNTSITVTLYSTKHVTAEQTDQTTSAQGVCTRVRTERTRTYTDGRETVDAVFAVYRPSEGVNCSGESTVPTTVPPDTTAPPDTTVPPASTTTTTLPPATTTTVPPPPSTDPPPEGG